MNKGRTNNNLHNAVSGIAWTSISSFLNILVHTVTTVVLSRLFSPEQFGVVSSVMIIVSFSSVFWMMGIGPAIVQRKDLSESDITTGNTLNIIFGLMVYLIVFLFSKVLMQFLNIENIKMIWILSSVFIIQSFSSVSESYFQRQMMFKQLSLLNFLMNISYGAATILLAYYFNMGVWALIFGYIISVFIKTVFILALTPIKIQLHINYKTAKELLYFGFGHTLSRIFNNLAVQGDYIVVNKTLGIEMLGLYNRAYSLLNLPASLIGNVLDSVLFPILSRYQDNKERLRYVYNNISVAILAITIPISAICVILSKEIIIFVLSEKWALVHEPFAILMTSLFFRTAYKTSDTLVKSLGAVYKRLKFQIIYAFTVMGGAFIGQFWGLNGVAYAIVCAIFINYILMLYLSIRLIDMRIMSFLQLHYPTFIIGFVSFIFTAYINFLLPETLSYFIEIIIISLVFISLYLIQFKLIVWRMFSSETCEFFLLIFDSVFRKAIKCKNKIQSYISFPK